MQDQASLQRRQYKQTLAPRAEKTRTRECDKLKEKGVKAKILLEHFEATKYFIHDGKVDESDASEVDVDSDDGDLEEDSDSDC